MKRVALIGHRGVGKTSFLDRIAQYHREAGRPATCIDLDQEIETRSGQSVRQVFEDQGESAFRALEKKAFLEIEARAQTLAGDVYVALGAGFDPSLIGEAWQAIWMRRTSDRSGRIFLDRPRLKVDGDRPVTPLEEYRYRFGDRDTGYRWRADVELWFDEGAEKQDAAERDLVLGRIHELGGAITVLPAMLKSDGATSHLVEYVSWGVRWFELRDDLLTDEEIEAALSLLPGDRVLFSFRAHERLASSKAVVETRALAFDWPSEFGACAVTGRQPEFLSLHFRGENEPIDAALERLSREYRVSARIKAALPIADFAELLRAHRWHLEDPKRRVFLPMSPSGRWQWYRGLMALADGSGFFRDGEGTSRDQPTLLQWVRMRALARAQRGRSGFANFAAILGEPVALSRTPMEQGGFFADEQFAAPVFAVRLSRDEWQAGALGHLKELGLRWAAVTAPLKDMAFASCGTTDGQTQELGTCNTLIWSEELAAWIGTNTDLHGLSTMINDLSRDSDLGPVAIWGGGGTLSAMAKALPGAEFFSARSGSNRSPAGAAADAFSPETVVWAAGSQREKMPPENWRPRRVVDLAYSEDSPAREYALAKSCAYVSGLAMFRAQAEAQRKFWTRSGGAR